MSTPRTLAIAVAAAVLVWMSAPSIAGPPAGRGHGGGPPAGRGHAGAAKDEVKGDKNEVKSDREAKGDQDKEVDVKGDNKKDAKDETTTGKKQADKAHAKKPSNEGGKCHGLARADQVAGPHGAQGRAIARAHAAPQGQGECQ